MGWITENTKKMKEIGFVKEWIILFLEVVTPYTIQKKNSLWKVGIEQS